MSAMRKLSAALAGVALVGGLGLAAAPARKAAPTKPRLQESQMSLEKEFIAKY